jgi:hypothetical protein
MAQVNSPAILNQKDITNKSTILVIDDESTLPAQVLVIDDIKGNLHGQVRVGTIRYENGKAIHPTFPGFKNIVCLTKSSQYGDIGPYVLSDENKTIFECYYQFLKVYNWVPAIRERLSRFQSIYWEHPLETHVENGILNNKWHLWNQKGFHNPDPVRYPVGKKHRGNCIGIVPPRLIKENKSPIRVDQLLGVVEGRKQVYFKEYNRLVKQELLFHKLQSKLRNGENLLIIEVDGPRAESLDYYKTTYNVENNFIQNDTILVDEKNMKIMLHDTRHSFGHGYCLAISLLEKEEWCA